MRRFIVAIPRKIAGALAWTLLPRSAREAIIGAPLVFVLVAIGYLYFLDREPIVAAKSEVLTPTVEQGQFFRLQYKIQWSGRCRVTGYRFIVDGAGYRHERFVDTRYVEQGEDDFTISLRVPLAATPGQAQYRGEVEYVCNPLQQLWPLRRNISVRHFEIVPGTPTADGLTMTFDDG